MWFSSSIRKCPSWEMLMKGEYPVSSLNERWMKLGLSTVFSWRFSFWMSERKHEANEFCLEASIQVKPYGPLMTLLLAVWMGAIIRTVKTTQRAEIYSNIHDMSFSVCWTVKKELCTKGILDHYNFCRMFYSPKNCDYSDGLYCLTWTNSIRFSTLQIFQNFVQTFFVLTDFGQLKTEDLEVFFDLTKIFVDFALFLAGKFSDFVQIRQNVSSQIVTAIFFQLTEPNSEWIDSVCRRTMRFIDRKYNLFTPFV